MVEAACVRRKEKSEENAVWGLTGQMGHGRVRTGKPRGTTQARKALVT